MTEKRLLITGFDPFGGETVNPAWEAVKLLPDTIAGAEVVRLEISTTFQRGGEELIAAVLHHQPSYVICVGQAGGRYGVMPEFVAINYRDARIPDNDGFQPIGEAVVAGGENAYFTAFVGQTALEISGIRLTERSVGRELDRASLRKAARRHDHAVTVARHLPRLGSDEGIYR